MNATWKTKFPLLLLVSLATIYPRSSHAQGTGRSMDIDLSIRSAGMGGASNALFWGDGLNHWGNPSLLGYVRGVGAEWGRTQLVPGLADDVVLSSVVFKLGGGGVGVVLSGQPLGIGGNHLDYGESEGTDEAGNPTGTYSSFEQVDSWGFGFNAVELVESLARVGGQDFPPVSRYGDVSFGMIFKDLEMRFGPVLGSGATSARDWGVLLRATPLDWSAEDRGARLRLDLAYGWSEINSNDDAIVTFLNEDQAPVTNHKRNGFAGHLAVSPAQWPPADWQGGGWVFLLDPSSPLISFGVTIDHADIGTVTTGSMFETKGRGVEINLANLVAYRRGHYEDKVGDIDGSTWGWSVSIPLGSVGRVRYEEARFPQARVSGLDDVTRRALSVWADPLAVWRGRD